MQGDDIAGEKEYAFPQEIFDETAEVISNLDILRFAIRERMPVSFNYKDKERFIEPMFLYSVNGGEYLVGYNIEIDRLMMYPLDEIGMVYLIKGKVTTKIVNISKDCTNMPDKKLLLKRMKNKSSTAKNTCCKVKAGQRVIGEIDEEGAYRLHSWDCKEVNKYWWT